MIKKYTEKEMQEAILNTQIRENIYWWNKSPWILARRHEARIDQIIEQHDSTLDGFKLNYERLENEKSGGNSSKSTRNTRVSTPVDNSAK